MNHPHGDGSVASDWGSMCTDGAHENGSQDAPPAAGSNLAARIATLEERAATKAAPVTGVPKTTFNYKRSGLAPDVQEILAVLDQDGDGQVSTGELLAAVKA